MPNGERRALLESLGFSFSEEFPEEQALSVEEVRRLDGAVDFAAHTRFHPVLTTCSDAECAVEIESAKPEIENLTGVVCADFSYPNGDYGEREVSLVRQAGYRSGRTIDLGWNGPHADPFRLKVLGTEDDASITRLASDLTGITGFLARVRLSSLTGRHPPVVKTGSGQDGTAVENQA